MFSEWIVPFFTLATLEIVLGIDNLVFLAIVTSRLPEKDRPSARRYGIALACITRILLLFSLSWLTRMTHDLFKIGEMGFSVRDLVLIFGGLFLIVKAIMEINNELKGANDTSNGEGAGSYWGAIAQIMVIDIVFSLDSVITAVGMTASMPNPTNALIVMVAAILAAVAIMLFASNPVGDFIERNPTVKMLALAFLILVGGALMADGLEIHIPRGYLYVAMAFSAGVEALNAMARRAKARQIDGE
jgi:predicted tellurium resistance membrane protein TerC